jgi:stringent starvation protein B
MDAPGNSTRPYLVRALHDWCTDNGYTPYVAVFVDDSVEVPREHVKNNEIVLNVSFDATSQLTLGNEWIEFQARFSGSARKVRVPMDHVIAIYARENGQGMAFPVPAPVGAVDEPLGDVEGSSVSEAAKGADSGPRLVPVAPGIGPTSEGLPPEPPSPGRPSLKRIK